MLAAAACGASLPRLAVADGDAPSSSFESAAGLYTASELGLGGRPLYQRLFPNGWPTTRDFRRMTLEDGEAAFADSIGSVLASGLGVPLDVSTYERWRLEQRQASEGGKAPGNMDVLMSQRWDAFRQIAGLAATPDAFRPVFIPYRRGDPVFEKTFDESKPWTWTWQTKGQDSAITLDAIGLSMYGYALFGEQQLAAEHVVPNNSSTTTFAGRTDVDGFLGLVALECATAELHELRSKLCLIAHGEGGKPALGAAPRNYEERVKKDEGRETFFPHGFAATVTRATVSYALGGEKIDQKSRLFDQASLILGLSELAKAAAPAKTGSGRFFTSEKRGSSFPETTSNDAIDLAIFVAESMRNLHWVPARGGCPASFATNEAPGDALRVEDAGLLLVALEQFLSLPSAKNDRLADSQKHMAFVLDRVATFLVNVQKTSSPPLTGFCDTYNLGGESAAELLKSGEEKRSLFAQGIVVRGLLAAKRASDLPSYTGKKHQDAKDAAALVLRWLEDKRWDKDRRAYVDEPGKGTKSRAIDAAGVLGGLRDMAIETGDARYLLRYKAYLQTLQSHGLFLAKTARSRGPLEGAKSPADAGRAPVVAAEVSIP